MSNWDLIVLGVTLALLGVTLWAGSTFIKGSTIEKVIASFCFLAAVVCIYVAGRTALNLYRQYSTSPANNAARRAAANAATAQATANMARLRNGFAAANARAVNAGNNAAAQVRVNMPNGIPQVAIRV